MNDTFYQLSLNILKALGGDVTIVYPDADAIWDEINKIYNNAGNRFDIVPLEKTITENGEYEYYPDGEADAFMPVNLTVNIPQKYTDEQVFEIESNAIKQGYDSGYSEGEIAGKLIGREEGYTDGFNTGYSDGVTDGGNAQKAKLVDITITESGVYTKEDGYKTVTVEVEGGIPEEELQQMLQDAMDEGYQDGYAEGVDDGREDGIAEQKEKLMGTFITKNGIYTREDGWNEVNVNVNVPLTVLSSINLEVKDNGSYMYEPESVDGWNKINLVVDVPTSGGDTGKPKIYNGFRFNGQVNNVTQTSEGIKQIDFSQYDWSNVYDTSDFFSGFVASHDGLRLKDSDFDNFRQHFNGKLLNCKSMFSSPVTNTPILKEIPDLGKFTTGCVSMANLFENQESLDPESITNFSSWDTSNVTTMNSMFDDCKTLTWIPLFDTGKVTNMAYMFNGCKKLETAPQFDTSNVTNMGNMFYNCTSLTSVPEFDMSNVTSCSSMFYGCTNLLELPNFNTKLMINWSSWLPSKLQKIGVIDCDSTTNVSGLLSSNTVLSEIGGFRNLGKQSNLTNTNSTGFLYTIPNISHESLLNVFNLLYDRAAAGYSVLTIKLASTQMEKLSDDDKAIAINKGWSLSS